MHLRRAAVAVLLVAPIVARAGPPFLTDDPEPVPFRNWELYLASQVEYGGGDRAGTLPHVEVNYGATPDLQLHLIVPRAFDRTGGVTEAGLGDLELGAKYRFLREDGWVPEVGTFPLVLVPTGDSERGLGASHVRVFLPVWLQKTLGRWTTYGGGGLWANPGEGNKDWWFLGWQVQRELSRMLILGAEVFHQTPSERGGEGETRFNLGAIVNLTDHHHVLASWGESFTVPRVKQGYVAYQLTFGPKE